MQKEAYYDSLIDVFEKAMQHRTCDGEHALFEVYRCHAWSGYHLHRELLTTVMGGSRMADLFSNLINTKYGDKKNPVDAATLAVRRYDWKKRVKDVIDELPVDTIYVFEDGSALNIDKGTVVELKEDPSAQSEVAGE